MHYYLKLGESVLQRLDERFASSGVPEAHRVLEGRCSEIAASYK